MRITRRQFLAATAVSPLALSQAAHGQPRFAELQTMVSDGQLPGFVCAFSQIGKEEIVAHGALSFDGTPMKPDTQFRVASLTKPLTALAALKLVEDGQLTLDGPLDQFLPELSNRPVLRTMESALHDTVPQERAVNLRDLLTCRFGLGLITVWPPDLPIQEAMIDAGISLGYALPQMSADQYMAKVASMPLATQPGSTFLYHNGLDVAGILIERVTGSALSEVLLRRIFEPLGMSDTAFKGDASRIATLYIPSNDGPKPMEITATTFASDPPMESGAAGIVSTAPDFLRFMQMMFNQGELNGIRVISREAIKSMISENLTLDQRQGAHAKPVLGSSQGWGLGLAVDYGSGPFQLSPGSFGWVGGYGSSAHVDPARELVGVLFTGMALASPEPPAPMISFWSELAR